MCRLVLALALLLGLSSPSAATVLSDAASALAVGSFVRIDQSMGGWNGGAILLPSGCSGDNMITQFGNTAVWNPVGKRFQFEGSPHAPCSGTNEKNVFYDDATDTWGSAAISQSANDPRHAYGHNAMDPATGTHYYMNYNSATLYSFANGASSWTNRGSKPTPQQCCRGNAWFPDRNSLIHWDGDWGLWEWTSAGGWVKRARGNGNAGGDGGLPQFTGGDQPAWVLYSARCHCVIFGDTFAKYNSDGTFTTLSKTGAPNLTCCTGTGQTNIAVDPVSGFLVTITSGNTLRTFDPGTTTAATGTWANPGISVPANLGGNGSEDLISAGISTYGVIMYVKGHGNPFVYLFKLTASNPNDADFAARCQGATHTTSGSGGVLRCFSFDSSVQLPRTNGAGGNECWGCDFGIMANNNEPNVPTIDTTTKTSGTGAMKFTINPGATGAGPGGSWFTHFGPNKTGQQGNGGRIFVQYRVRWSPEIIQYNLWPGGGGAKVMDISLGDLATCNSSNPSSALCPTSCPNQGFEFVLLDNQNKGYPSVYANCNGTAAFTALATFTTPPSADVNMQNMISTCSTGGPAANCRIWRTNEWMTFKIMLGGPGFTWNTWSAPVKVWMGREGQPLELIIDCESGVTPSCTRDFSSAVNGWFFVNSDPTNARMGKVYLHPYRTGTSVYNGSVAATVHYDELIISTQDIADPGGGAQPIPPASPTGFRIVP